MMEICMKKWIRSLMAARKLLDQKEVVGKSQLSLLTLTPLQITNLTSGPLFNRLKI